MNELVIMTIVKKALITGVTVGGPILIISLVVTFVPKLIAIILVLVLGGPWMLNKLVMLTNELFQSISTIVN